MKPINHRPSQDLTKINRGFEEERLRGLRMENTQRSVLCYGWFAVTTVSIFAVIVIVVLMGIGLIVLPETVALALIGATIANGMAHLLTIIKGLFSNRE